MAEGMSKGALPHVDIMKSLPKSNFLVPSVL